ncbi:MAG: hypothetical protein V3U35_05510 [Candidatus Neomarinimicrobiota bacterium]
MTDKLTPPNEEITNEEAIRTLSNMVEAPDATNESTGACIYIAAGKQYCNNLTQAQCNALKGAWFQGEKCP